MNSGKQRDYTQNAIARRANIFSIALCSLVKRRQNHPISLLHPQRAFHSLL